MEENGYRTNASENSSSPVNNAPQNDGPRYGAPRYDGGYYRRMRPVRRLIGILVIGLLVFGAAYAGAHINTPRSGSTTSLNSSANDGNAVVTESETQISNIATKVGPSVVSIVSEGQAPSSTNRFYPYGGSNTTVSAGTGIIVSSDGYVMTNKHVIDGASKVSVQTSDGTTYDDVTVIGSDPLNDLAFVKIKNVKDLTAAQIGNSSTVRQGQGVIAIGNALGQYQNSVTAGIISGIGRPVTAGSEDSEQTETLDDLIQTDAAINSGNSGGPLVNYQGQVIGINTAVASDAQSIGFSIPINATKGVLKGVLENGKIARAYLGVAFIAVTPAVQKEFNLGTSEGAYVYSEQGSPVVSGSPADKAGIQNKDVITKVNEDTVGKNGGLSSLLAQYTPGQKVTLTVLRGGKTQTLDATLTQYTN